MLSACLLCYAMLHTVVYRTLHALCYAMLHTRYQVPGTRVYSIRLQAVNRIGIYETRVAQLVAQLLAV